jgi:hypothetical protein
MGRESLAKARLRVVEVVEDGRTDTDTDAPVPALPAAVLDA